MNTEFTVGIICTSATLSPYQEAELLAVLRELDQTRVQYRLRCVPKISDTLLSALSTPRQVGVEMQAFLKSPEDTAAHLAATCDLVCICLTRQQGRGKNKCMASAVHQALVNRGYVHLRVFRKWLSADVMGSLR